MDERPLRLAVIVLAAGAGSRFSDRPGEKLLAPIDARPVLDHVLEAVRAYGPAATIVVLGHGAGSIEATIDWANETRVTNQSPDRGLASSLRVGIDTLEAHDAPLDGTFIVLGDQPRLRTDVLRALENAAATQHGAERPLVVPRYVADAGPRNPVLLLRPLWDAARDLEGDHGLLPLIEARPDLVLEVDVAGSMPDVDTPDDLARL